MAELTSSKLYAYLGGSWEEITDDEMGEIPIDWGIPDSGPLSRLADPGSMKFQIHDPDGLYTPGLSTTLEDWGAGTKIKLVLTYDSIDYIRFYGRIPVEGIEITLVNTTVIVSVTVLDWMHYAITHPILSPTYQADIKANDAINTVVLSMPIQPLFNSYAIGVNTFPATGDNGTTKTVAYTEFVKNVLSEMGYLYLKKDYDNGERLFFENNYTRNGLRTLKTVGGNDVILDNTMMSAEIAHGRGLVNRASVRVYPKKIDSTVKTLYSLSSPLKIGPGQTITVRGGYTDPTGGGAKVNAVTSRMIDPVAPGDPDPYLVALLHCNGPDLSTTITDETGNTWTQTGSAIIENTITKLGGGAIQFGGVNEEVHGDDIPGFDFGTDDFTVEYYAYLRNPVAGAALMARDATSSFPSFLFGYSDGTNLRAFFSSDNATWDIGDNRDMGVITLDVWCHYAICRQGNKFFIFKDGALTDTWYSDGTIAASSDDWSIGRTRNTQYQYVYLDEFRIEKGICLYTEDFTPTKIEFTTTLFGDYLLNTEADGSGTDLSADLDISVEYGSEAPYYTLTNNSGDDGHLIWLRARGYGVYSYNPIDTSAESTTSQEAYGYQTITLDQQYQRELSPGRQEIKKIVELEKKPRTELYSVTCNANRSDEMMKAFLNVDIGDLVQIIVTQAGIDGWYYIQGVSARISPGGIVMFTWIVRRSFSLLAGLSLIGLTFTGGETDSVGFEYLPQVSNLETMSISAWVKIDSLTPGMWIVNNYVPDAGGYALSVLATSGHLYFVHIHEGGADWESDDSIPTGEWVHVAITRDATTPTDPPVFYVNGQSVAFTENTGPTGDLKDATGAQFTLGNDVNPGYVAGVYEGNLLDARIYDVALSAGDVEDIYNEGPAGINVTSGIVFQGPAVRTTELALYEGETLTEETKVLENMYGMVGDPRGVPVGCNGYVVWLRNIASDSGNAVSLLDWDHTIEDGRNRAIVVMVSARGSDAVSTMVRGTQTFELMAANESGNTSADARTEVWRLLNPDVGTDSIDVVMVGSSVLVAVSMDFGNVDQSEAPWSVTGNSATGTGPGIIVASDENQLVIDVLTTFDGVTVDPTQSEKHNETIGGLVSGVSASIPRGASISMDWTIDSSQVYQLVGLSIPNG